MESTLVKRRGLSWEALRIIACLTMLIDHTGAVLFPRLRLLRIIGRLAFPIFCYQLSEGLHYTKNSGKYLGRLCIAALIAEIPYDLAIMDRITFGRQSVMVTLVLGFIALYSLHDSRRPWLAFLVVPACYYLAEWLHTDYHGNGVLLVLAFGIARRLPYRRLWELALVGIVCWCIGGFRVSLLGMRIPVEMFGLLSLPLIWLENGHRQWKNNAATIFFYSFYPVHLLILYLIRVLR